MTIIKLTKEQVSKRILRAIRKGHHNTKYIIEASKLEFQYVDFCEVIAELQTKGLLVYRDAGYYLA